MQATAVSGRAVSGPSMLSPQRRALVRRALVCRAVVCRAVVRRALVRRALVCRALVYRAWVGRALVGLPLLVAPLSACRVSPTPPSQHASTTQHHDGNGHRHEGGHHRFDDPEKWSQVFDDPQRDAWQKPGAIIDWLKLSPDAVVADIGAGTGYFSVLFAAAVPQGKVIANDVEPTMVAYLQQRAKREKLDNLVAVRGLSSDPQLGVNVDLAFVCDVYHHIKDRPAYFSSLARTLEEDGRLVFVDFAPGAPLDAPGPPKAMRITPKQVEAELTEAGFKLRRAQHDLLKYQYILEFELAGP